jgi:tetratricopeptide (TPR) repeat protein
MVSQFNQSFTETQFLLNTTATSDEYLKRGLSLANAQLRSLGDEFGSFRLDEGWPAYLAGFERERLREQLIELVILEARARLTVASRHGSEEDRRRETERAIGRLTMVEASFGEAPAALHAERARYYAGLGFAEEAAADRRRAAARPPKTCHDLTLVATTLFAAGDLAGAEETLRLALQQDFTSFWAWYVLGHCHFGQRRYLESAGDFAVCATKEPAFAWIHFNCGLALASAGRLQLAQDSYDRALHADPRFTEALVNRALVELELNQLERARADLSEAILLGRSDLVVFTALAETWARLGRRAESERYFAMLLERDPRNLIVRTARGMSRVASDPTGALGDFQEVLKLDDRSALAHYGLALVVRHEDLAKALDHLNRALDSNPNLIDAVQLRALVRARLGDQGSLGDVDRLLESPTSHRLYNAACAVAILSEKAGDPRLLSKSFDLLTRALEGGISPRDAISDPDLKSLRDQARFGQLIARFARSRE